MGSTAKRESLYTIILFSGGSKRTGPDLARIGGKYPDSWHYNHMLDPRIMSPGSIMPSYPWLLEVKVDTAITGAKIRAMQTLGVPYPTGYDKRANTDLIAQANRIVINLKKDKLLASNTSELVALIAYMQRMGTDIKLQEREEKPIVSR